MKPLLTCPTSEMMKTSTSVFVLFSYFPSAGIAIKMNLLDNPIKVLTIFICVCVCACAHAHAPVPVFEIICLKCCTFPFQQENKNKTFIELLTNLD